jgi:hypothetical protein
VDRTGDVFRDPYGRSGARRLAVGITPPPSPAFQRNDRAGFSPAHPRTLTGVSAVVRSTGFPKPPCGYSGSWPSRSTSRAVEFPWARRRIAHSGTPSGSRPRARRTTRTLRRCDRGWVAVVLLRSVDLVSLLRDASVFAPNLPRPVCDGLGQVVRVSSHPRGYHQLREKR